MEKSDSSPVSAIILAGGRSRRLGQDKALLRLRGQPLLARTVHTLSALSSDLVVVSNTPEHYEPLALPVRYVPDERQGRGSLMGIYSGLKAVHRPHALVVACDMPFLNLPLLRYMLTLIEDHDVVVPRVGDFFEPLHAMYGRGCLPMMGHLLDQGQRRILSVFAEVRVRYVSAAEIEPFDPQHRSFININTSEDWERVQELVAASP
jgi:molybdopterin-guanine dinucleotide biosynthesis protein A